jgi:hypothetical protein
VSAALVVALAGAALLAACTDPDVAGRTWHCATDDDCVAGYVCGETGACVVASAGRGDSDSAGADTAGADAVAPDVSAPAPLGVAEGLHRFRCDWSASLGFLLEVFGDVQVNQLTGDWVAVVTYSGPEDGAPDDSGDAFVLTVRGRITRDASGLHFESEPFTLSMVLGPVAATFRDARLRGDISSDPAAGSSRWDGVVVADELVTSRGADEQAQAAPQGGFQLVELLPAEAPKGLPRVCSEDPCAGFRSDRCDVPFERGWPPALVCDGSDGPDLDCSDGACARDCAACGPGESCRAGRCRRRCAAYPDCDYVGAEELCLAVEGGAALCLSPAEVALARCGDGACDESERYAPGSCPRDCPTPPPRPYPAGGPCTAADDCETDFCLDTAFVAVFLPPGIDVPGGYCSSPPLANPCTADADCGAGGICADASALVGMSLELCLHACGADADCRHEEGYRCFTTQDAPDAVRACLPGGLIAAVRCGDGVCDPAEVANPGQCTEEARAADCP